MVKKRLFFTLFFALFCAALSSAQETYNTLIYEGNSQFNRKNYDDASSRYMDAIKLKNRDFAGYYNLGNALYKRQKYKEAEAEYQKAEAIAKTKADKMAAIYNQGNVQMQSNNAEKAAQLYKKALKMDPYNEKIRKNYEVAMLKNQQQKEQQNKKNNQDQNKEGKNKDQNPNKDGESQQQQSGGNQQQQQGQGKDNNQNQNTTPNNGEMPKDLENAILNRVGNKEKETAKRILNKNAYSMPQSNEKDW